MIVESVVRVILHCSRCNTPFVDDYDGDDRPILWDQAELEKAFSDDLAAGFREGFEDVQGWIRLDDRVLCHDCWEYTEDGDQRTEKAPLPAVDAAKVTRAQARYEHRTREVTAHGRPPAEMSLADLLTILDDVRAHVAAGDSWEGSLEYLIPEEPGEGKDIAVRAGYRIGNTMGQGGFRLIEGEAS